MKHPFLVFLALLASIFMSCQEEDISGSATDENSAATLVTIPPPTLSTIASPFTDKIKLGINVESFQQDNTVYCLALGENQKQPTVQKLVEDKRTVVVAMNGRVFRSALIDELSPDSIYTIYAAIDSAGYFSELAQLSAATQDQ